VTLAHRMLNGRAKRFTQADYAGSRVSVRGLRRTMQRKGVPDREMCYQVDISRHELRRMKLGLHSPTTQVAEALAEVLGVPLKALLRET
jgi:transcriptional regulator with XRE-family HTH domain